MDIVPLYNHLLKWITELSDLSSTINQPHLKLKTKEKQKDELTIRGGEKEDVINLR